MKPYLNDLRERVISAVDHHEGTLSHIARRFQVSLKTVRRWLQRRRQTGSLDPAPHGGGRHRAVDGQDAERLKQLVRERPDATLDEMNTSLGLDCSRMAIARALVRLGISRKKKSLHASERDTPKVKRKCRDFRRKLAQVDPKHLVFVDETCAPHGDDSLLWSGPSGSTRRGLGAGALGVGDVGHGGAAGGSVQPNRVPWCDGHAHIRELCGTDSGSGTGSR